MQFDLLILCLIGTALAAAAVTFLLDAARYFRSAVASPSRQSGNSSVDARGRATAG
jgi:hypothetical protein